MIKLERVSPEELEELSFRELPQYPRIQTLVDYFRRKCDPENIRRRPIILYGVEGKEYISPINPSQVMGTLALGLCDYPIGTHHTYDSYLKSYFNSVQATEEWDPQLLQIQTAEFNAREMFPHISPTNRGL